MRSPTATEVGLDVVEIFVTCGNETTTPGTDFAITIRVKIRHETPTGFDVPPVPIVKLIDGFGSGTSFQAREPWALEAFFGLTISAKSLPLLKCI